MDHVETERTRHTRDVAYDSDRYAARADIWQPIDACVRSASLKLLFSPITINLSGGIWCIVRGSSGRHSQSQQAAQRPARVERPSKDWEPARNRISRMPAIRDDRVSGSTSRYFKQLGEPRHVLACRELYGCHWGGPSRFTAKMSN